MKELILIYAGDFETYPMGGVLEYVKNFARYLPEEIEISLVGITLNPQQAVGQWTTVRLGDKERAFLPLLFVDEAKQNRSKIPLNAKFTRALRKLRPELLSRGAPLYLQRAEHATPFQNDALPLFLNTHGQSGFLEKQMQHPLFRFRWMRQWYYRMEAKVMRRVQRVITISPYDYEYYVKKFPHLREKFSSVPLGVETDVYVPPLQNSKSWGEPRVLFVGRLHAAKGLDLLLDGFALFLEWYPTAKLTIVGGSQDYDPIEEQVKNWIEQRRLSGSTHRTGLVAKEQILTFYQSSDIFVMTSLWEGLPNALLEAMACGLPVVVTAVGGLPSVVKEDINGYLVQEREPQQVALKMKLAYENRQRIGLEARKTAESYSIRGHAAKVCSLFFDNNGTELNGELTQSVV